MTSTQLKESSGFVKTPTGLKAVVLKELPNGMVRILYWESEKLADIELSRLKPWTGK